MLSPGLHAAKTLGHLLFGRMIQVNRIAAERITFPVSPVSPASKPLPEVPCCEAVACFLGGPVEACSHYHGQLVAHVRSHPLIAALHAAFSLHHPLCLSPDIIWLTLTQGLAHHVHAHAEELRHQFVKYLDKGENRYPQ